jgi:hypothetical protein
MGGTLKKGKTKALRFDGEQFKKHATAVVCDL